MEGYFVENTWSVFESHSRNTFCKGNVFEEAKAEFRLPGFDCSKTKLESTKKKAKEMKDIW